MRQSCTRRLSSSINGEGTVLNGAKESRPNRVVYSEEPPKIEQKCNKNGELNWLSMSDTNELFLTKAHG